MLKLLHPYQLQARAELSVEVLNERNEDLEALLGDLKQEVDHGFSSTVLRRMHSQHSGSQQAGDRVRAKAERRRAS